MHGWVPITVQVVTGVALLLAVGWRTRRWRLRWLPVAALAGGAVAYGTRAYVSRLSDRTGARLRCGYGPGWPGWPRRC